MTSAGSGGSLCIICGDPAATSGAHAENSGNGSAYCAACHDMFRAAPRTGNAALAVAPPPRAAEHWIMCPGCGQQAPTDEILCSRCGYSFLRRAMPQRSAPARERDESINPLLWPLCLVFWPRRVARELVDESVATFTLLFAFLFALARAIELLDNRIVLSQVQRVSIGVPDSWGLFAVGALINSLIFLPIIWWLGAWWYRVRMQFSGAHGVSLRLARRLYVYPAALFAVPVIGVTAVNATKHSSPGFAAIAELDWLALVPVVGLFWSVWNSYRGVRVVCHRRPFMAALMFLILPILLYAAATGAVIYQFVTEAMAEPRTYAPRQHTTSAMTLQYPDNWWVDDTHASANFQTEVAITCAADVRVHFQVYESSQSLEAELSAATDWLKNRYGPIKRQREFATWGRYQGVGASWTTRDGPTNYGVDIFIAALPGDRRLCVTITCARDVSEFARPGLDLIERSFTAK